MLDINKLSSKYNIRKLNSGDIEMIYNFCKENKQYYKYCEKELSIDLIKQDLTIVPLNFDKERKFYLGFFDNNKLVAVLDFLNGYPNENYVFIGFFMLKNSLQGQGLGSEIIQETLSYLKQIGFEKCKLGIDKSNPQSNYFWKKNGFEIISEVKVENNEILVAEKIL